MHQFLFVLFCFLSFCIPENFFIELWKLSLKIIEVPGKKKKKSYLSPERISLASGRQLE